MGLSCPVHQKMVLELLDRHRPWMATFAFPCRGGSSAQALNIAPGRGQRVADTYQTDETFVVFSARGMRIKAKNNLLALAENPQTSQYWKHAEIQALVQDGLYEKVDADQ